MTRAAGYIRVSTEDQKEHGWNLDADRKRIKAIIAENKWEPGPIYDDGGLQGDDPDRPGFNAMLAAAAAGEFDVLVLRSLDRLSRDMELFMRARNVLGKAKVAVYDFDGLRKLDTLESGIKALIAEEEKRQIGKRVHQMKEARAKAGGHNGGKRIYGYVSEGGVLQPHPTEADVVREIFEWADAGVSQRQIAQRLDRAGHRTVYGKRFQQGQVGHMLGNPIYKGMIRRSEPDGSWTLYPGQHQAIVGADLWNRVNAARKMRASAKGYAGAGGRPVRGLHLLRRGMLRCDQCGGAMIPHTRGGDSDVQTYICMTRRNHGPEACSRSSITRESVDGRLLRELTRRYIDREATRERLARRRSTDLAAARLAVELAEHDLLAVNADARLAFIKRKWQEEVLSDDDYASDRQEIQQEHAAAQAALDQASARVALLEAGLDAADAEEITLRHLADLKAAIAGQLDKAPDLSALRTLIGQVLDHVVLLDDDTLLPIPRVNGQLPDGRFDYSGSEPRALEIMGEEPTQSTCR